MSGLMFSGARVTLSAHASSPVFTLRTWRQRWSSSDIGAGPWYSRPWEPWRRFNVRHEPKAYLTEFGWVMHPAIWEQVKRRAEAVK